MDDFLFDAPAFEIIKSYRDDNGQMFVEGVASTTSIDETGERMSTEAIAKMAARLIGKYLRSEHGRGWDDKLGEIVKADVKQDDNNRPALWIKARLYDWSSKAKDLFNLLTDGAKMGLSVAGRIKPGGIVKQFVEAVGKYVPTYIDVEPTEVSVTDHPANLDTWALAVSKSLDETSGEEVNNVDKGKLVSKTVNKDVADLIKQFNPSADVEIKEIKKTEEPIVEKKDDVKKEEPSSSSTTTPPTSTETKVEEKAAPASTEPSSTTTTPTSDGKTATKAEEQKLDDILKELTNTLSSLKSSLGPSTDSSTDTTDSDESGVMEALKLCMDKMKSYMGTKKTKKAEPTSPSSDTTTPPSSTSTDVGKVLESVEELKTFVKTLEDKVNSLPNMRKGYARIIEKNLGEDEEAKKTDEKSEEMLKKLKDDPEVTMAEYHKYRNFGILPAKYREVNKE